jgi:hypothetical protein
MKRLKCFSALLTFFVAETPPKSKTKHAAYILFHRRLASRTRDVVLMPPRDLQRLLEIFLVSRNGLYMLKILCSIFLDKFSIFYSICFVENWKLDNGSN